MTEQLLSVTDYLEAHEVDYEVGHHPKTFTAQETAGAQHVSGKQMVKSVIVKAGGHYIMCVLPAVHLLDFAKLEQAAGTRDLALATEGEIAQLFPHSEVGAEPPFGTWEGQALPVYMDRALEGIDSIVFNAGSHTETVRMNLGDYKQLAEPTVADIGIPV